MRLRWKQVVSSLLAISAAVVGGWALLGPASFFADFPLPGHHWVAPLGPYNEHLTRDVGGLYLSLCLLSVWTSLRPGDETMRLTGAAWLIFSVPHLLFHLAHLGMFDVVDAAGNVITLGGTVVLAALLLLPTRPGDRSRPTT